MITNVLKFRVWDKNHFETDNDSFWIQNGKAFFDSSYGDDFSLSEIENAVIQQFTGLLDKNGKEIYEGDIIKGFANYKGVEYEFSGIISFQGCGFWCENADFPLDQYQEFNILGNIFENPSLLSEK